MRMGVDGTCCRGACGRLPAAQGRAREAESRAGAVGAAAGVRMLVD
jgi:hypothetical protein